MVNNRGLRGIGADITPYSDGVSEEELRDAAKYFLDVFENADQTIFHSGKSPKENLERLTLADDLSKCLKSGDNNLQVYANQCQSELIEVAEAFENLEVNYLNPETTIQEIY